VKGFRAIRLRATVVDYKRPEHAGQRDAVTAVAATSDRLASGAPQA